MPKIVYKCENPRCRYPDVVIDDPVDDNLPCKCGLTKWGHHKNTEDLAKKAAFEAAKMAPCPWCQSTDYEQVRGDDGWWVNTCCGGN